MSNCRRTSLWADFDSKWPSPLTTLAATDRNTQTKSLDWQLAWFSPNFSRTSYTTTTCQTYHLDLWLDQLELCQAVICTCTCNFSVWPWLWPWHTKNITIYFNCYIHNVSGHLRSLRHHGNRHFYFDMAEVPVDELLTGAELRLYKYASDVIDANATFILNIYNIVPGHNEGWVLVQWY